MDVFARTHVGSRAPRLASDEPLAAVFAGTPPQVAGYLAQRMTTQPETLGPLTDELTHLANFGHRGDSLSLMLGGDRKVTGCLYVETLRVADAEKIAQGLSSRFPQATVGVYRLLCEIRPA